MQTLILRLTMAKHKQACIYSRIPLTKADNEALETLFQGVPIEDFRQLEEITSYYSITPLEPWEEEGWVMNSSLSVSGETTL